MSATPERRERNRRTPTNQRSKAMANGQVKNGADRAPSDEAPKTPRPTYRFTGDLPTALEPLRTSQRWVVWDYVWNDKKKDWGKPPRSARTGRIASINNPTNLGTFAEAVATAARLELAGVGYVLMSDDDLTGIDLDDCISAGTLSALAAEIVGYGETYAETSPSGEGIRLFAKGKIAKALLDKASGVEAYGTGRYLTITGQQIEGTPPEIRSAPNTLAKINAVVDAAQSEKRAKPNGDGRTKPNGKAKANSKAQADGDSFWSNVNTAALANLDSWVLELHPTADKQEATGAWRVKSSDLGRDLEEDLSYHPNGVNDFGEEEGLSPIDAVQKFRVGISDAVAAAMWLCQQLGIEPASLGWQAKAKAVPQEARGEQKSSETQGSFMLVREWTDERAVIMAAFRREVQKHHPDKGGDPAAFRRLVEAKDRALKSASERRVGPGVYFNDGTDEEPKWRWFCSQLEPLARTRGKDNRNWGRLLETVDRDGVPHVWAMPARIGPTVGDGTDFRRELVDRGLEIASGGKARNHLSDYVTIWKPSRTVRCVSTIGWCGEFFVLPNGTYGGAEEVVLQAEGVAPEFKTEGNLDNWRRDIAALCAGNSRLMFGLSMGFAGPLLYLANEESGGVHFHGPSSIGKTTILHVARSVWGTPLGSWRTTDNSAEATAAGACDTLKTLDEISRPPPMSSTSWRTCSAISAANPA